MASGINIRTILLLRVYLAFTEVSVTKSNTYRSWWRNDWI